MGRGRSKLNSIPAEGKQIKIFGGAFNDDGSPKAAIYTLYGSIPEGWRETKNVSSPYGYIAIDNGKSRFSGERKKGLIKDNNISDKQRRAEEAKTKNPFLKYSDTQIEKMIKDTQHEIRNQSGLLALRNGNDMKIENQISSRKRELKQLQYENKRRNRNKNK